MFEYIQLLFPQNILWFNLLSFQFVGLLLVWTSDTVLAAPVYLFYRMLRNSLVIHNAKANDIYLHLKPKPNFVWKEKFCTVIL